MVAVELPYLQEHMNQALAVSKQALPLCRPNPPVGCVLVRGAEVLVSGYTHGPGEYHAEAHALALYSAKYQTDMAGVDAFVTLEPCSFAGKTPSCAEALVRVGIKRVYVAMLDPDPRNSGRGIKILEAAGIEVNLGLCGESVAAFLKPYLIVAA